MQELQQLLEVMQQLRDPESGCPWDLEQTFSTIAPYTIEEAYEVADAIERDDPEDILDELGDLLLQVVFHAQMAAERGWFDFSDVAKTISEKMIRRHPHVFAEAHCESAEEVKVAWETIKQAERATKAASTQAASLAASILADVPNNLPGMTRAVKLTKRAAMVGFDWPDVQGPLAKVEEEIAELEVELETGSQQRQEQEFGDVLFALANVARHLKIDPEKALRGANQRFINRFNYVEQQVESQQKSMQESSLAQQDAYWREAKSQEIS